MTELQREIIVIPATIERGRPGKSNKLIRVASYSRVSTNFEDQLKSFHLQKSYYTDLILKTPGWKFAGTFADEGLSGVSAKNRPDFQKLMRYCREGKVDMIITKSISRFSRNTMDTVQYVRNLKALNVAVYFEKENINSLEVTSEFIMTIIAGIAQEESNSLSKNVKMGIRMGMQAGKVHWRYNTAYGFIKGEDGNPEIVPEHAVIIRQIFESYLSGDSEETIAKSLNADNVPCKNNGSRWNKSTLQGILQNERFCGDVILQKTFVEDHISKKVRINNGELPKIHIKNNHPAIVSREQFEKAQLERARRNSRQKIAKNAVTEQGKYSSMYALREVLVCGHCGSSYSRKTWKNRDGSYKYVWRCSKRMQYGVKYCSKSATIEESDIHTTVVDALTTVGNSVASLTPIISEHLEQAVRVSTGVTENTAELEQRLNSLRNQIDKMIQLEKSDVDLSEIARMAEEMREISEVINREKSTDTATAEIEKTIQTVTTQLLQIPQDMTEYDDKIVRQSISVIKVREKGAVTVVFKDGSEVVAEVVQNH